MEQLFKNSKNIVYMLTSGFFLMACLCLFCLIIEMITAISAGKSPNILDPIFFGCAFSIFTWFFSFTGPLQLRFVQKLVQLNSDDFIYSTDKTIKKFRDGHTVTEYYAFVHFRFCYLLRWGEPPVGRAVPASRPSSRLGGTPCPTWRTTHLYPTLGTKCHPIRPFIS